MCMNGRISCSACGGNRHGRRSHQRQSWRRSWGSLSSSGLCDSSGSWGWWWGWLWRQHAAVPLLVMSMAFSNLSVLQAAAAASAAAAATATTTLTADVGPPTGFLLDINSPKNVSFAQLQSSLSPPDADGLDAEHSAGAEHVVRRPRSLLMRRASHVESCPIGGGGGGPDSVVDEGECMLALYCVIAGGQASGRCGNSIFYTCCQKRAATRTSRGFSLSSVLGSTDTELTAQSIGLGAPHALVGAPHALDGPHVTAAPAAAAAAATTTTGAQQSPPSHHDDGMCGRTNSHKTFQRRIIGGDDAHFGEFPWQAHIKIGRQQCGGALVSHRYVITAAHCVRATPNRRINIVLGTYDIHASRGSPARTFRVVQKKIHPKFAFSASQPDRFDVALLRLDRYVHYQDNILPACLPPRGWSFEGWRATVTGWGKTDPSLNGRYGTRVLQKIEVPIITRAECESWHQLRGIHINVEPEMMCAGYKEGKRDACVGDSGGPMTLPLNGRWTIVGITSAGFGCAQSHQPGIYHQVSASVDWIIANL